MWVLPVAPVRWLRRCLVQGHCVRGGMCTVCRTVPAGPCALARRTGVDLRQRSHFRLSPLSHYNDLADRQFPYGAALLMISVTDTLFNTRHIQQSMSSSARGVLPSALSPLSPARALRSRRLPRCPATMSLVTASRRAPAAAPPQPLSRSGPHTPPSCQTAQRSAAQCGRKPCCVFVRLQSLRSSLAHRLQLCECSRTACLAA